MDAKKKKRRIITETASKISTVEVENKFTSISYLNNLLFKASNKLIVELYEDSGLYQF